MIKREMKNIFCLVSILLSQSIFSKALYIFNDFPSKLTIFLDNGAVKAGMSTTGIFIKRISFQLGPKRYNGKVNADLCI